MIVEKRELEVRKENSKRKDIYHRIQEEAAMLKANLDDEINKSLDKTQDELLQMRKLLKTLTDMASER
jgi:hypothetical protein